MSAQDHSPSIVERLTHAFNEWLKHRQELSEMRHLNAAEFDRIASDLRLSPAALDELVRHGPRAADELPKLLQALGISQDFRAWPQRASVASATMAAFGGRADMRRSPCNAAF